MPGTESAAYAERLVKRSSAWWKRVLPVQAPYRWNLRRQRLGRTLDVGCGIGRNLGVLAHGSVGIDHNGASISMARAAGYEAYTTDEWRATGPCAPGTFDAMLLAHVVEHMSRSAALQLLRDYLPYIRPGGRVMFVCPQERGYASDPTHESWTSGADLESLARAAGLIPQPWRSFPFRAAAGRWFTYNEFHVLARVPD